MSDFLAGSLIMLVGVLTGWAACNVTYKKIFQERREMKQFEEQNKQK